MKKNPIARAVLSACILLTTSELAAAAEWTPELRPPLSGARGPADPIRIRLPKLPTAVVERLALELDDVDVTALVSREGNDAVFTPPQALPFGAHQVRLVEYAEDGSVIERGAWTVDVRKTATFREAELRVSSTLNALYRVADNNLPDDAPKKLQGNGAAQIYGAVADGDWRMQGNMDLLYNSQRALMPRQKHQLDAGLFLLKAENGPLSAAAGHQTVAPDSFVMQGFQRRGLSVGLGRESDAVSARLFALRTQEIVGFEDGLGIGDSENRVQGAAIVGYPVSSRRDALVLMATYVDGEGPTFGGGSGSGISGDPFPAGGNAAGIVADSNLLDRRVRLRGEYATSNYDFDGIDTGDDAESDTAYSALATYSPWNDKIANDLPLALQFGLENKRIGTFFRSPANPVALSDRKATRGFSTLSWGGLSVLASIGRETDNVNDIDLLPRTETAQQSLSFNYTPALATPTDPAQAPTLPWYGQPTFSVTWLDLDQDITKASPSLAQGALHATQTVSATASFSYTTWNWALSHTVGEDTDFLDLVADTESTMTQLSINVIAFEKLTLGPAIQISRIENLDDGSLSSDTLTAVLNLGYLFSERVNFNLGYSVNQQETDDGSIDTQSTDVTSALNWIYLAPQERRPGVAFAIEGQYHDVNDRADSTNDQNNYQIFFKTSLSWSPTY
jgi:hypothetical protein